MFLRIVKFRHAREHLSWQASSCEVATVVNEEHPWERIVQRGMQADSPKRGVFLSIAGWDFVRTRKLIPEKNRNIRERKEPAQKTA